MSQLCVAFQFSTAPVVNLIHGLILSKLCKCLNSAALACYKECGGSPPYLKVPPIFFPAPILKPRKLTVRNRDALNQPAAQPVWHLHPLPLFAAAVAFSLALTAPPASTTHESQGVILEQTAPESASSSTALSVAVLPVSRARSRNKSASMTQEMTVPHRRVPIVAVPASSSMDAHLLYLRLKRESTIPFTSLFITFNHQRSNKKRYCNYCIVSLNIFQLDGEVQIVRAPFLNSYNSYYSSGINLSTCLSSKHIHGYVTSQR